MHQRLQTFLIPESFNVHTQNKMKKKTEEEEEKKATLFLLSFYLFVLCVAVWSRLFMIGA